MPRIQVEIEYPLTFLLFGLSCVGAFFLLETHFGIDPTAVGGVHHQTSESVVHAELEIEKLRREQSVLSKREDILRYEYSILQKEYDQFSGSWSEEERVAYIEARAELLKLLQDSREAEAAIRLYLRQIWDAEGRAFSVSHDPGELKLSWPVEPELGISAVYHDAAYEKRFGMRHHGVDIPVKQGSVIRAAADGVIESVKDNGLGFNSVIIRHAGGSTLYGHVSVFLVEEGETIRRGEPIALSGGRPGSPGAGFSTGPHVHLEVRRDGVLVDPMLYLEKRS